MSKKLSDKKPGKRAPFAEPQIHPFSGVCVEKGLLPEWIFEGFITIALAVPNLVFSGTSWFDTLHLMKWFITLVPVGILSVMAGSRLAMYGARKTGFVFDPFGLMWLGMLAFIAMQPLWAPIRSFPTMFKEWMALGGLVSVYLLSYNLFTTGNMIRIALWGANINAALNVVFAELQIRNLCAPFSFIMNTPGNYIGNTGQQEMFGLWMAMALLNGVYLHIAYGGDEDEGGRIRQGAFLKWANLAVLAINAWGLWNSTARGGILSLIVGFAVFGIMTLRNFGMSYLRRLGAIAAVICVVLVITFGVGAMTDTGSRAAGLAGKTMDMVKNPTSVGMRIGIWRSSWEMFKANPVTGVGFGQFKWNYLGAQRAMFDKYPDGEWQFTFWAHSEYLQWLGEFGIPGGVILAVMAAIWLWGFLKALLRGDKLPLEVLWASGMVFLISFNALFSRPWHRLENVIWLALAFALTARTYVPNKLSWTEDARPWIIRGFGGVWAGCALLGLVYMVDGMVGDRYIYTAMTNSDAGVRMGWLEKAEKHLMYREEAVKQKAYLLMKVGDLQSNAAAYASGLIMLEQSFNARADAQMMMDLVNGYSKVGNIQKVQELTGYLKPGSFAVQSQPVAPPASK